MRQQRFFVRQDRWKASSMNSSNRANFCSIVLLNAANEERPWPGRPSIRGQDELIKTEERTRLRGEWDDQAGFVA